MAGDQSDKKDVSINLLDLINHVSKNGVDEATLEIFKLLTKNKGIEIVQKPKTTNSKNDSTVVFDGDNLIITKPTSHLMNTTKIINELGKKKKADFVKPTPLTVGYEREKGKKTKEPIAEILLKVDLPAEIDLYNVHDLNYFDLSVYDAICTLWESKNEFMTLSMIVREIAPKYETELIESTDEKGKTSKQLVKTNEKTNYIKPETRALVLNSLKKLSETLIIVDYSKHYDLKGIQDGIVREAGAIIELRPVTMRQKGVDIDGFIFNSPLLLRYSKNVNHISTISKKVLDLNTTMTPEIIAIRRWIQFRYNHIKENDRNFKMNRSNKGKKLSENHRTIRYDQIIEQVERVKMDTLRSKIELLKGELPNNLLPVKKIDPDTVKNQIEKAEKELEKIQSTGLTDKQKRTIRENIFSVLTGLKENGEFLDFKTATDKGKRAITKAIVIL